MPKFLEVVGRYADQKVEQRYLINSEQIVYAIESLNRPDTWTLLYMIAGAPVYVKLPFSEFAKLLHVKTAQVVAESDEKTPEEIFREELTQPRAL